MVELAMSRQAARKGLAIAMLAVMLGACAPAGPIEIDCDAFYQDPNQVSQVALRAGDEITVRLCSNPSTGYQWTEEAEIGDTDVLVQQSHAYQAPPEEGGPPAPGTPGVEVWVFRAIGSGESVTRLEYSQPWEGGEKAAWTFNLTIEVK
jgi:predicted secreted protein